MDLKDGLKRHRHKYKFSNYNTEKTINMNNSGTNIEPFQLVKCWILSSLQAIKYENNKSIKKNIYTCNISLLQTILYKKQRKET